VSAAWAGLPVCISALEENVQSSCVNPEFYGLASPYKPCIKQHKFRDLVPLVGWLWYTVPQAKRQDLFLFLGGPVLLQPSEERVASAAKSNPSLPV
jgi:hypothetical protein